MIILFIVILWVTFVIMAFSTLSAKNHRNNQVFGISLSKEHFQYSEVKELIDSFKKASYLIMLISMGLSFLLYLPSLQAIGEVYMLILIVFNLYLNWHVLNGYGNKLMAIKKKYNWIYPIRTTKTVDLNVTKEKGKSSISSFWVWLFAVLSFAPTVILLLNPEIQEMYPIGFSLIGPLTQLLMVYLYYKMRNAHSKVIDEKTDINIAFAKEEERINSITASSSALSMLLFWFLFNLKIVHMENGLFIIVPIVFLTVSLLSIGAWHQKRIGELEESIHGYLLDDMTQEEEPKWRWGCYYDPSDSRILVPKRIPSMGMTINIGRPAGKAIFFGIIVLLISIIVLLMYGSLKDYEIIIMRDEILIDAPIYDMNIKKDELVSISLIDEMPGGTRTNGYGGSDKSYGNFNMNNYGRSKLYVYNRINRYVVLELDGNNPSYVFINAKTAEDTEDLYEDIKRWFEN